MSLHVCPSIVLWGSKGQKLLRTKQAIVLTVLKGNTHLEGKYWRATLKLVHWDSMRQRQLVPQQPQ